MAPSQINNITVERNSQNGLLYYSLKGNSYLLNVIQGDLFKIQDSDFNGFIISKAPEIRFYEIKTNDGSRTFVLMPTIQAVGGRGGGGRSSIGIQGVTVKDGGVQVNGTITTFNFSGNGVTVADGGGGTANISIPGYVIASLTTSQRLALTPSTALIVEDTDLDMYFKWSTVSSAWSPF